MALRRRQKGWPLRLDARGSASGRLVDRLIGLLLQHAGRFLMNRMEIEMLKLSRIRVTLAHALPDSSVMRSMNSRSNCNWLSSRFASRTLGSMDLTKFFWLTALAAALIVPASGATIRIGPEAELTLPSSAQWKSIIGDSPADGSVQLFNPPLFKWIYQEVPSRNDNSVRSFRFQLSTNKEFTTLIWNIVSSNNFYNFLPPITNQNGSVWLGSNYWRVIYMSPDATVNLATGAVHHFTLAPDAAPWNRAMLADNNYILNLGRQHPHIFFWQTNRDAVSTFVRTSRWPTVGLTWQNYSNAAFQTINQTWWNDDSFTNQNVYNRTFEVAQVAFVYQMTTNATLLAADPMSMAERLALEWMRKGIDRRPAYNIGASPPKHLALIYDWLYNEMTPTQRSNVLYALEKTAQFYLYDDYWWYNSVPAVRNRDYTNPLVNYFYSAAKIGSSHEREDCGAGLFLTLAGMGESAVLRELQSYFLNYAIGQSDPYWGDEGRGYSEQECFKVDRNFSAVMASMVLFQDAKLWQNPIFTEQSRFFAFWEPVNYQSPLDPWGDLGLNTKSQMYHTRYFDEALISGNGALLQHYNRSYLVRAAGPDNFPLLGEVFVPYYFSRPIEKSWPTNVYINQETGWAMSYTFQPNSWSCFANGVGFVFQARPAGSRIEHSSFTDGQIQLWAYGAQATVGGVGNYGKHPMYYNGLFVDGIGVMNPQSPPSDPWYSRLIAFTNTSDFTYVAGDLTKAFNRTNYNAQGLGNATYPFYTYATNLRPYVVSVQRHVLFPHKKYLVIFDEMEASQAAQFQWKWNIWEPTASMDASNNGFTYTCTNMFGGSNVTIYVKHIVDPALMSMTNVVGAELAKFNPFTGENYAGVDGDTQINWRSAVWAYNKTPSRKWHFMSVIFPAKWGQAAPTITRIDDYTVRVQQGPNDDTINVDTTMPTPSFTLDLTGPSLESSVERLQPPRNVRRR